jgi:positive phototaxis protein PixI
MNSANNILSKSSQQNSGDSYLKFQLNQETAAVLSLKHTQEAIVVPIDGITSMPNMPSCILGLMNWRSKIIWVVDLPRMLNLESLDNRFRQYNVVVIRTESMLMGLVVQEIKGTIRFLSEEIRSPLGQVASSLVPYLRGCIEQQQETLLVLDAQAIVDSSVLRINK